MRANLPIAACCCMLALSGCATRPPAAELAPAPATKPTAIAKDNRFDMSQNGRRMSAEDFDAWMKARGIRIAKGKPSTKSATNPSTSPKAQRKRQTDR